MRFNRRKNRCGWILYESNPLPGVSVTISQDEKSNGEPGQWMLRFTVHEFKGVIRGFRRKKDAAARIKKILAGDMPYWEYPYIWMFDGEDMKREES